MKSNRKTKKVLAIAVVTALIAVSIFIFLALRQNSKTRSDVSEKTKSQTEQSDSEKAKSVDNKNSKQNQAQPVSQAGRASIDITSAEQSDNKLIVSAIVNNATSGTCTLQLSKGSTIVTKSAPIALQVSYYVCQGFIIDSSELQPKGEWELYIKLDSPSGSFQTPTRKADIK